ncbi:response regulator [Congregicoccus parvus]|uniref:ATP-binding response regulator n=1 Tax=Congregicoccus parvus TaxID=3081749 RepID=UPI003FA59D5B
MTTTPCPGETTSPPAPRILIVEDEAVVAEDIAVRLRRMGYQVIGTVNAGEDGYLLADRLRPDLVLMDIVLKGRMDGVETAERIGSDLGLPVVFLTAHGDPGTFTRAKATVPRGYVLKPFSEGDLHRSIELALGQHRETRKLDGARRSLSDTLRTIADCIIAVDTTGCVTYLNEAAEAVLGCSGALASGRHVDEVMELTHIDREEVVASSVATALHSGRTTSNAAPLRIRSSLGRETIVEETATPVSNGPGEIIGVVVMLRVLAERSGTQDERSQLITALRVASRDSLALRAALPVCAWCKRIHTTKGEWKTIEELIGMSPELQMSHGICPACSRQLESSF